MVQPRWSLPWLAVVLTLCLFLAQAGTAASTSSILPPKSSVVLTKANTGKACADKKQAACDASVVPSFVRLALRYRGGEASSMAAKPADLNASRTAGGNVMSVASEAAAEDSEEEVEEEEEGAEKNQPVESEEATYHDAVEAEDEKEAASTTTPTATPAGEDAGAEEEEEDEEEKAAVASVSQELSGPEAVRRKRAENGDNRKKDKYNAKMQWVITNRMKKILVEELHYAPEEVEVMMPDVAAVVINKHLERPKRGMPPEWRKDFHMRSRGLKRVGVALRSALRRVVEEPQALIRGVVALGLVGVSGLMVKRYRDGAVEEEEEWEWVEMTPWEEFVDNIQSRFPGRK